ncbi:Asp-tRNA(Asn)/Glu-tRNA(Gln) amidotransferase subunit GatA [Phenylobacterium sp. VNQ135]|uniref:Asp-tRNA(Asn)/Glu-tRNA(Gln) amidotransferase subunit GatA n=1 Tax=Phenylobacterium sp. VNQ135 TaxID=3400922 RepID=UPI003C06DD11
MKLALKNIDPSPSPPLTLAETLANRDLEAIDNAEEHIRRIEAQADLNAYITVSSERARAQAERSGDRLRRGDGRALEGAPLAVKDNFCTEDIRTTAGSRILENFIPTYESTVTARLLAAGAVFLGKTNMDEFGMGSSTENSAYGRTLNPRGLALGYNDLVPGGSSGGSAAAVAANLCLASVATDTGGSIRQPASFCGVVGFKPSYGACSRWGVVAYASSLDQPGVITKTVEDAAIIMDVISGNDPKDSTSCPHPPGDFVQDLNSCPERPIVGIPNAFRNVEGSPDLEALWSNIEDLLRESGAEVRYIDLPSVRYSLPAYYVLALCEASSNLARYDGVRYGYRAEGVKSLTEMYEVTRAQGFGEEVKRRVLLGTFALSAGYYDQYYLKAAKVRSVVSREMATAFEDVHWMVWPTAPSPAFGFGQHTKDPLSMYLEDLFTVPVNLAGLPAISVPGFTAKNGLPMGFQLVGRLGGDVGVLAFANRLEQLLRVATKQ